jgi:non-specific serine/threonine protein kinase
MPSENEQQYRWAFGAGEFDETALRLTRHGEPLQVEPKPLKLLAFLLRNAGEIVTRDEIQSEVWEDRVTVANAIPTAIGKLRKALDDDCTIRIETVPRSGYRLVGEYERTAVGRIASNRLSLVSGDPVPLRSEWVLTEQIKATAYSDVWLARDRSGMSQRVFKFPIDGGRLSSLKREAALNRLLAESLGERDDIALMADTNFSEPPFFVAYEYEGLNLREWAETGDRFRGMGRDERLALFSRVCGAVSAAHGVGILHKDIKPENILIAERPDGSLAVKLGDFGSGELLEPEQLERLRLTREATAASREDSDQSGTLMYMAPELAQTGTATVRSDVFALGVVLFQMLTGDFGRPLTPGWRRDIDDELVIEDIAAATDQDPARRPDSAAELARRIDSLALRRQRAKEAKRRKAEFEQAQRELERQRARRPWIWGLVATLTLGLGLSIHLYREAEEGRRQAEAFVEKMQAVQQFLSRDIIGRANPLNPQYDPEAGIGAVLDSAAKTIDERFGDTPRAAAGLHRSVAGAFAALRRDEAALEHFGKAYALYADTLGPTNPTTAGVGYEQASALVRSQEYDRARELIARIDSETDRRFEHHPEVAYRRAFSQALLHAGLYDIETAVQFFQQAIEHYRTADLREPNQLARFQLAMADAHIRLAQPEQAQKIAEQLQSEGREGAMPGDIVAMTTRTLARAHRDLGDDHRALALARQAVEQMTALYGEAHYQTIITLSLVAQMQGRLDDCDGTLATSRRVFELMRDLYGANYSSTLIEQNNLGTKQFRCGHEEEGIANVRAAIEGLEAQFGARNRAVFQIRFYLAMYLHETDQHAESLVHLNQLENIALDKTEGIAITPAEILLWRGRVLDALGRSSDAQADLERALRYARASDSDQELLAEIDSELLALSYRQTGHVPGG